ncbi:hypothetical protein [Brevundimonas nasdae]|uniref:hypothetical protein n=1 Tax=Brevundimonas nasdae TaxID=172043 RepID=UPI003F68F2FE
MHATAAICSDTKPGIVFRRYCSRPLADACTCGLPQTISGWSLGKLSRLKLAMERHRSLFAAAAEIGETSRRANLALDAMLGADLVQALAILEARASRAKHQAEKAALARALSLPAVREALDALRVAL